MSDLIKSLRSKLLYFIPAAMGINEGVCIVELSTEECRFLLETVNFYASRWISVEDYLPKKGQDVLCVQDPIKTATKKPLFAIFDGKDFIPPAPTIFADYTYAKSKWAHITHWMPLPETPKR